MSSKEKIAKKNRLYILLYVFVCLLYALPVVAGRQYPSEETIRQTYHVTSDADSGPGSLRVILKEIASQDRGKFFGDAIIYFNVPDGVIKPKTSLPEITQNINFIGPVSLDLSGVRELRPFMTISNADCVFDKVNFQDMSLPLPPPESFDINPEPPYYRPFYELEPNTVILYWGGKGTFADCVFSNNKSYGMGGVIYQKGDGRFDRGRGTLSFFRCEFVNNVAELSGGAIYSSAKLTLIDCLFENNLTGTLPPLPRPPPPPPPPPQSPDSPSGMLPIAIFPQRLGGAIWGQFVDMIRCVFRNNRTLYSEPYILNVNKFRLRVLFHKLRFTIVSSDSFTDANKFFYWDFHALTYGKCHAVIGKEALNIKDCVLIEDFDE